MIEPSESRLAADLEPWRQLELRRGRPREAPRVHPAGGGLRARRALVEAARPSLAMVFFGIQGSVAQATNRDRVLNNAYISRSAPARLHRPGARTQV